MPLFHYINELYKLLFMPIFPLLFSTVHPWAVVVHHNGKSDEPFPILRQAWITKKRWMVLLKRGSFDFSPRFRCGIVSRFMPTPFIYQNHKVFVQIG